VSRSPPRGTKVALVHLGREEEAGRRADELRRAGYVVAVVGRMSGTALRRRMDHEKPAAVVIDLTRVPSEGQAVALSLLTYRPTRELPIVFADGAPEKVARVRANVPDGVFASGTALVAALAACLAAPRRPAAARPRSVFAPYQGVPLARKLGIKPASTVALVSPPEGIDETLAPLPEGATLRRGLRGRHDLIIWFVRRAAGLEADIERVAGLLGRDGLWICWPKKSSGSASDLSHGVVQRCGLAAGLMDYKICSVDETWSALRFTRRS